MKNKKYKNEEKNKDSLIYIPLAGMFSWPFYTSSHHYVTCVCIVPWKDVNETYLLYSKEYVSCFTYNNWLPLWMVAVLKLLISMYQQWKQDAELFRVIRFLYVITTYYITLELFGRRFYTIRGNTQYNILKWVGE